MATKAERALARAQSTAAAARKRAAANKDRIVRKGSMAASSYMLGALERNGHLQRLSVGGVGAVPLLALGATVASMKINGTAGDVLEGVGDGAIAITTYKMGKGDSIAGDANVGADDRNPTAALPRTVDPLEREIRRMEKAAAREAILDAIVDDAAE